MPVIIDGLDFGSGSAKWGMNICPAPKPEKADCTTAVYSEITEHWLGFIAYDFDKYLVVNQTVYGMRHGQTFELNKGGNIKGLPVEAWVLTAAAPDQIKDKEFIRIRINSDNKPTLVEFYMNMDEYLAGTPVAVLDPSVNPLALKDYHGFEQYVPRKTVSKDRIQGRVMLYRIHHTTEDVEFTLMDTEIQYKHLK